MRDGNLVCFGIGALCVTGALLYGCNAFKAPYSGGTTAIDESSSQAPARIRLDPPQVFTREQLLNDRQREDAFLTGQLSRSATEPLGSNLARDLQAISVLAAQFSLSFDPAAGANFQRQTQSADLQQQINAIQLEGQLVALRNQLNALEAGTGVGPAAPATPPSTSVTSTASTSVPDQRIKDLEARVDSELTYLRTTQSAAIRTNSVSGTLEDDFEDRLALRTRIREAINANALDDAHDLDGNALFHLQFVATVLPGHNKRQFGIASLNIEPPVLHQSDVDLLYSTWLATMTNRMNRTVDDRTAIKPAMSYEMLGPITGLYDVGELSVAGTTLSLAVWPGYGGDFRGIFQSNDVELKKYQHAPDALRDFADILPDILEGLPDGPHKLFLAAQATAGTNTSSNSVHGNTVRQFFPALPADSNLGDVEISTLVQYSEKLVRLVPSVEASVLALGDRSLIPDQVKEEAKGDLAIFEDGLSAARYILGQVEKGCREDAAHPTAAGVSDCDQYDAPAIQTKSSHAPVDFCKALFVEAPHQPLQCPDGGIPPSGWTAGGIAFPYSADPVLRSQRVSTVASAATALELAAAVAAQIPQAGASVGAGLDYSQNAAGRVDAIERVPQVFGFAGPADVQPLRTTKPNTGDVAASTGSSGTAVAESEETYEFGWVFGPTMTLDPSGQSLVLQQTARTHAVSADISVPAWWPGASLQVRTAWKGAFAGGGDLLSSEDADKKNWDTYELPIRFSRNEAAFDALTVQLTRVLTSQGFRQARIDLVRPSVIPYCTNGRSTTITLLIYGVDIWRDPVVIIDGVAVPPDGVRILPDMMGISATFDTSRLWTSLPSDQDTLVVWTAHGAAEAKVKLVSSSTCESGITPLAGLQPAHGYVVGPKSDVTLALPSGTASPQYSDAKLGVRLRLPNGSLSDAALSDTASYDPVTRSFTGNVDFSAGPFKTLKLSNGVQLLPILQLRQQSWTSPLEISAGRDIVYYIDSDHASIGPSGKTIKKPKDVVVFTMPANVTLAYPDFHSSLPIAAAIKDDPSSKVTAMVQPPATNAGVTFSVALDLSNLSADKLKAKQTISLKFQPTETNNDVPNIADVTYSPTP